MAYEQFMAQLVTIIHFRTVIESTQYATGRQPTGYVQCLYGHLGEVCACHSRYQLLPGYTALPLFLQDNPTFGENERHLGLCAMRYGQVCHSTLHIITEKACSWYVVLIDMVK